MGHTHIRRYLKLGSDLCTPRVRYLRYEWVVSPYMLSILLDVHASSIEAISIDASSLLHIRCFAPQPSQFPETGRDGAEVDGARALIIYDRA